MRWHKEGDRQDQDSNIMVHPSDGEAWQALDRFDPEFARDPRSVRLGLSTDGFTPYTNNSTSYSYWLVFMMPYNLPPNKCMKEGVLFLALIVSGPKDPVTKINVFMQPLIEELKALWQGLEAYDSADGQLDDYYGILQDITEYTFGGHKPLRLVTFDCIWFDLQAGT
jgi:hypothetical protein